MLVQKERTCRSSQAGGWVPSSVEDPDPHLFTGTGSSKDKRVFGIKLTVMIWGKEKYDMQGTYLFASNNEGSV
jgi:hypothetical protein